MIPFPLQSHPFVELWIIILVDPKVAMMIVVPHEFGEHLSTTCSVGVPKNYYHFQQLDLMGREKTFLLFPTLQFCPMVESDMLQLG